MRITYLGHSCFEIQTKGKKILIDPFLIMSPNYDFSDVTDIFVLSALYKTPSSNIKLVF